MSSFGSGWGEMERDGWDTLRAWREDPYAAAWTYSTGTMFETMLVGAALTEFFALVRIYDACNVACRSGLQDGWGSRPTVPQPHEFWWYSEEGTS